MTSPPNNEPQDFVPELADDVLALLGDEATWESVPDDRQESIVASVLREIELFDGASADDPARADAAGPHAAVPSPQAAVVPMPSRWRAAALGAAAALVVVAGLFGLSRLGGDSPDLEVALAGTDLAPAASAIAEVTELDEGTRIVITIDDLPPAAPGTYYEAWLRKDAEVGVSAGTFHLREGNGPIELWAGVLVDDYPLLTVTIQDEAQTESSGRVVLKVLIE